MTATLPAVGGGTPAAGKAPLVVGLDLSLTGTGVAHLNGAQAVTELVTSTGAVGIVRLRRLRRTICELVGDGVTLVVIEGPSYGSVGAGSHDRAGLWWMVRDRLWQRTIPVAVVPPSSLKQYATGKGNASKGAMIDATARRWPQVKTGADDNRCDALWLAAMGADALGCGHVVPESHRKALGKVTWPAAGPGAGQASGA